MVACGDVTIECGVETITLGVRSFSVPNVADCENTDTPNVLVPNPLGLGFEVDAKMGVGLLETGACGLLGDFLVGLGVVESSELSEVFCSRLSRLKGFGSEKSCVELNNLELKLGMLHDQQIHEALQFPRYTYVFVSMVRHFWWYQSLHVPSHSMAGVSSVHGSWHKPQG